MVEAASNQEQEVKYNNELFRRFIRTYHLTKQWEDFIKENPLERENPILDVDIRNIDMSVRLLNVLYHSSRENITTLRDVVLIGKKRISRIRNLGTKSLNELEKILADNNLHWDTSTNERKLPF